MKAATQVRHTCKQPESRKAAEGFGAYKNGRRIKATKGNDQDVSPSSSPQQKMPTRAATMKKSNSEKYSNKADMLCSSSFSSGCNNTTGAGLFHGRVEAGRWQKEDAGTSEGFFPHMSAKP
jgi:hypothetical protein